MNPLLGILAALATSVVWAATSVAFTFATLRAGPMAVNRVRLVMAVAWLVLAHLALGIALPWGAEGRRWLLLGASGIVGLVVGDGCLFQAFLWIGPRLAMLLLSTAPAMAGLGAWWLLGEGLSPTQFLGILVTLGGVAWVVLARQEGSGRGTSGRHYALGILCGLGGAAGQAAGLLLAKMGAADAFPALSVTLMRMTAATLVIWLHTALRGQIRETLDRFGTDRPAWAYTLTGSVFGPFVGVTLSIIAIQNVAVGIASTLMALPPVFLLPLAALVFKERIGWQAVFGTAVATLGVALLCLA